MIIASVLVAIAITEVVGWWGKLLRNKQIREVGGLHRAWSALFICTIVLYWSGFWSYEDLKIVNYAQIWMLLLPTLLAILVAFAITPTSTEPSFTFHTYYEDNRKLIFFCWALFFAGAGVADVVMLESLDMEGALLVGVMIGILVTCGLTRNVWFQYVGLIILFTLILVIPVILGFSETLGFFSGA